MKLPNLNLKTQSKQLLGYLRIDILLLAHFVGSPFHSSTCLPVHPLSVCPSICLLSTCSSPICLPVYLSVCLSVYGLSPSPASTFIHLCREYQRGNITVPLTSCLTGLNWSVLKIKTKILNCHTTDSKPVKQEVNSTVILLPLVFPDLSVCPPVCSYICESIVCLLACPLSH